MIIKTSVEGWENQDDLIYYVEKGYSDEQEYYERYKYDGAISSDISLVFEGEGELNVISSKKEGIEGKGDITINSGTLKVDSLDDGINACTDNVSDIIINGGTVIVKVNIEAEEGDGIDSNNKLTINGGTVISCAYPGSDNGVDADQGVYINGGTVISTGDMQEQFKSENNQNILQLSLSSKVNEGDTIVVVDKDGNVVFAYKTDRSFSAFGYSSDELTSQDYTIYTGTDVTGTVDENGVYTKIDSVNLDNLTKQENSQNLVVNTSLLKPGNYYLFALYEDKNHTPHYTVLYTTLNIEKGIFNLKKAVSYVGQDWNEADAEEIINHLTFAVEYYFSTYGDVFNTTDTSGNVVKALTAKYLNDNNAVRTNLDDLFTDPTNGINYEICGGGYGSFTGKFKLIETKNNKEIRYDSTDNNTTVKLVYVLDNDWHYEYYEDDPTEYDATLSIIKCAKVKKKMYLMLYIKFQKVLWIFWA